MKKTITQFEFRQAFLNWDTYKDSFSWEGLNALFDYLSRLEEDIDAEIELDVVAFACEYTEYSDWEDFKANYPEIEDMEELRDNTNVIEIEGKEGFIIQQF